MERSVRNGTAPQARKIITFLLITTALSVPFWALWIGLDTERAGLMDYVMGLTWCPAAAALLTKRLYREPFSDLGWRWGSNRFHVAAYVLPIAYGLAAYLPVWIFGLGRFYNPDFVATVAQQYGWAGLPSDLVVVAYVLVKAGPGLLPVLVYALGEEIGWRGFLVPELAKVTSYPLTAIGSGFIWAAWHYPIMIFASYNAGTPIWFGLICFTISVVGNSFAYTWLRLRSGSLWNSTILHGSHNLFIQRIFNPLTAGTAVSAYVIGEFGIALAITGTVVGVVFWRLGPPDSTVDQC
jgi:membrane protease YdiL (CAAX protease family)